MQFYATTAAGPATAAPSNVFGADYGDEANDAASQAGRVLPGAAIHPNALMDEMPRFGVYCPVWLDRWNRSCTTLPKTTMAS